MIDVFTHFTAVKWSEVKPQTNTLHKLPETRFVEFVAQFGLSRENDAQHLLLVGLDSRNQANLFQDLAREILRLVDHEYDFLAV